MSGNTQSLQQYSNQAPHQRNGYNNQSQQQGFDMQQRKHDEGANMGAIAIEQERAIAEARGQIQLAKMFPRSLAEAQQELLEACKDPEFAKSAFYSVPNRGSGPSIRFAEEVARCYGNFEYGHRELSRTKGKSEIEVFAWDKEKNNVSKRQITVAHTLDYTDKKTKQKKTRPLIDQADIDNRIANVASKQMRGRIMALLPKALVEIGLRECRETIAGRSEQGIQANRIAMMRDFNSLGINVAMLTKYLGHSVDEATTDDLADLFGVSNAIRQGAKIRDYFGTEGTKTTATTSLKNLNKEN